MFAFFYQLTEQRMNSVFLVTFSGLDRSGLTRKLVGVLSRFEISILDIGQSVIHDNLSLGFLLKVPQSRDFSKLFQPLAKKAESLQLKMRHKEISLPDYQRWVREQGQPRHIITLLGKALSALNLERITEVFEDHHLNIEKVYRQSGRIPLTENNASHHSCIEISVKGPIANRHQLYKQLLDICQKFDIDSSIQKDDLYRKNRRLVCFDMDSTLIQTEVIDQLAIRAGQGKAVSEVTERAMNGEIDFDESFCQRVALLKGLRAEVLTEVAEELPMTKGIDRMMNCLKKVGYKTAILSGGFQYFAEYLQKKFSIDYVYANQLEILNGKVTGKIHQPVINGERKASLLKKLTTENGWHLEQVIAVGDGANDLPMLSCAGLGIAFHAKPLVKQKAEHSLNTTGLDGVLYLLGMNDRDINNIL